MTRNEDRPPQNRVFLTGATGFVGKVVLTELIRRRDELDLAEVFLLIRPREDKSPAARFEEVIAGSQATDPLEEGWESLCTVVGGELTEGSCGMSPVDVRRVARATTHVIHCAASVEFTLPVAEAARANIDTALNVLELAKTCENLEAMATISTAYVTPFEGEDVPVREEPVHLGRPASEYYEAIKRDTRSESEMLEETGHPNTYTFTKCIGEHLLMDNRGEVPLRVVRPSVVSASLRRPHPGWVDSMAAYCGYLSFVALGHLRAFVGRPDNRLDVVPCDVVSDRVIEAAFAPSSRWSTPVPLIHAVAGYENACRLDRGTEIARRFFAEHRLGSGPRLKHLGPPDHGFQAAFWRHQKLPHLVKDALLGLVGADRARRALRKVESTAEYMNEAFYYFTQNNFDFRTSRPLDDDFDPIAYNEITMRGVYEYLLGGDDTEMILAGRRDYDQRGDLQVVSDRPDGNASVRFLGVVLRRFLNKYAEKVTFDAAAFRRAMEQKPDEAVTVVVPTHRSFLDFLICSYLFYVRPELGVELPYIPATSDFEEVAIVNRLFEHARALYIDRGVGRAQEHVNEKIDQIVASDGSLLFFPEGTRSRSRRFLKPRRGLLRALRRTGRPCHLLPVTLSFDRVPEQDALERELRGEPRGDLRLSGLLRWGAKLVRSDFDLGRIHLTCAEPVELESDSDVYQVARAISTRHQAAMSTSTFHLRTFLAHTGLDAQIGVDWLAEAIEERGGRVVSSRLEAADDERLLEHSTRYQWMHRFYGDALRLWPDHPIVEHHIEHNVRRTPPPSRSRDEGRIELIVRALFAPIAKHYRAAARWLDNAGPHDEPIAPAVLLEARDDLFAPYLREACAFFAARDVLRAVDGGEAFEPGPRFDDLDRIASQLELPVDRATDEQASTAAAE